ncbi:hypothetical protein QYF36_000241 [Acer negundo]|nr:hypothetical protein QYF36_000241 [Acer negundo]
MDWSGRWRGEEVVNKKEEKGSAYVVRSLESIELLFCSYGSYSVGGQHSLWVPIMSVHSLQHWTLQSYLSLTKTPHCVNICAAAKPQPLDLRSSYVRFRGVVVTTRSYFTGTESDVVLLLMMVVKQPYRPRNGCSQSDAFGPNNIKRVPPQT